MARSQAPCDIPGDADYRGRQQSMNRDLGVLPVVAVKPAQLDLNKPSELVNLPL